ncbi:hypothetical protein [Neorhizobium sp. T7_12]|uniref:hypothetical protein n=1 Tax=Neorhizobium sp. T7_12 TaxID=2093832 RepID=UPI00155E99CB|nr:hypothetical protein [Neorhizobium sp. T7_12]
MTTAISLQQWLVERGLTYQEADLWSEFISDALLLLEDGHSLLRTPQEWRSFLGGCKTTRPTEPEITSGLGDRMRRLRNDAEIDSNRDRIHVSYESPTPGDERHGNRKSKADFRFERKFEAGRAVAFVMEAKPLRTPGDITGRYLATDGLGCFIERQPPYSKELAAGMVAYAFTNPSTWLTALMTALSGGVAASRMAPIELGLQRTSLASDHGRPGLGLDALTVLHAVLDFADESVAD